MLTGTLMIPLVKIFKYQSFPCFLFLEASVSYAHDSQSLLRTHSSWGRGKRREPGPLCTPIASCKRLTAGSLQCPRPWAQAMGPLCGASPNATSYSQPYFFLFCFEEIQTRECIPSVRQWTCPVAHRNACISPDRQTHQESHVDFLFLKFLL